MWLEDDGGWLVTLPAVGLAAALVLIDITAGNNTPSGLLSAAAILVLVMVAGPAHLNVPPARTTSLLAATLRAMFLPLMLAASIIVVSALPGLLEKAAGGVPGKGLPFTPWLRALMVGVLTVLNAKLLLLKRYTAVARSRNTIATETLVDRMLPTQERDLQDIRQAIVWGRITDDARLVQIEGRWGEGKSFLLARLEAYLHLHRETTSTGRLLPVPAVILVDVWKHEAEPDLHLAIIEDLLSHPCYLAGFGWLHYPTLLVVGRYLGTLLLKLALPGKGAAVDVAVKVPRLPWQRSFQVLVANQRRRGRRTVIVLDEIDRAAAPMSQVAVTLTRRSLDLPGVTVVLSYVEELIRFKAFNPLNPGLLPDLQSSMEAEIYEEMLDPRSSAGHDYAEGSVFGRLGAKDLCHPDPVERRTPWQVDLLSAELRRWYACAPANTRAVLQARFSEKFLGLRPIILRRLGHNDVAEMLFKFTSLQDLAHEIGGPDRDASRAAVVAALDAWAVREDLEPGKAPPIRALEGEFARLLTGALAGSGLVAAPPTLAFYVLVGFYNALSRSRR